MYELMNLFNDANVERFVKNLRSLSREFDRKYFATPRSFFTTSPFTKEDDLYKVEFDVAEGATAKDVSVDLEDDVLTVSYSYKAKGFESTFEWSETLPEDADADTLNATVEDGKLVITAEVKEPVEDDEPVEAEDTTRVRINRK